MGLLTTFLFVLKDFANWSTVAAVPHIANAHSIISRLFWVFIFILMSAIFLSQPFPQITICNANPYKMNMVDENLKKLMDDYSSSILPKPGPSSYHFWGNMTESQKDRRALDAMMLIVSDHPQDAATYGFKEMILTCRQNGENCTEVKWTTFSSPRFGLCHQLATPIKQTQAGFAAGIKLVIFVDAITNKTNKPTVSNYLPITRKAGVIVALDQPGAHPTLETASKLAVAGYETFITMSYNYRLKGPYGKCVDKEGSLTNYYEDYEYLDKTCYLGCRQRYAVKYCGCANPRYLKDESMKYCSSSFADINKHLDCIARLRGFQKANGSISTDCMDPILIDILELNVRQRKRPSLKTENEKNEKNVVEQNMDVAADCQCQPACQSQTFNAFYSRGGYPISDKIPQDIIDSLPYEIPHKKRPNMSTVAKQYLAANMLILQFAYNVLSFEVYQEIPAYPLGTMINDLGGHAGLWLGLSIISIIEMIGLGVVTGIFCFTRGRLRIRPEQKDVYMDERIRAVNQLEDEIKCLDNEHARAAKARES